MENYDYTNYGGVNEQTNLSFSNYLARCFAWMFFGLLLTTIAGVALIYSGLLAALLNPVSVIVILLAEVVVVFVLAARIHSLRPATAKALFIAYALLNSLTFSGIFLLYDMNTLIFSFTSAAALFGVMAVLGYTTKVDLSRLRNILFIGLICLLVTTIVAAIIGYVNSDGWIVFSSVIGIGLFTLITAYDVQRLKKLHASDLSEDRKQAIVIYGALQLYLDFINIFIYILRLVGRYNK